jgi:hypothetical protein
VRSPAARVASKVAVGKEEEVSLGWIGIRRGGEKRLGWMAGEVASS